MITAPPATSAYKLCPVCLNIYPASANFCARDQEALVPDSRIFEGKFVLLRQIGAGTMGEVFEAEQPRLRRKVALKLLRPDPEVMERFDQEVEAAGSLNHPHVVTIYDSGRTGDGRGYIVMEYLEGQSLAERLRQRGPLQVGAAVHLWLQAVRAMAAAHAQGVVHRDLKPDNLFLSQRVDDDSGGGAGGPRELVKVLDFSIAKLAPPLTGKAARRSGRGTLPGSLIGTMQYMAPEQLEHGEADARSDVYALGLILVEMLTGRLPWGETRDESFALFALRLLRPPRLLREMLKPGLYSPELEALIGDTLNREPAGRPAHAGELLQRARLLPDLRGDTGPLRALASHSSSEGVTAQVVAPPVRPGDSGQQATAGSAHSEKTTETSVTAPQGRLAETTPPAGSPTDTAVQIPEEVTPRIPSGRVHKPTPVTPRVPIGGSPQQTLQLIELPASGARWEAERGPPLEQPAAPRTQPSGVLEATATATVTVTELPAVPGLGMTPATQMLPRVQRAEVTADRRASRRRAGRLVAGLLGVGITTMLCTLVWLLWGQSGGPPAGAPAARAPDLREQPEAPRAAQAEGAPLVVHFAISKPWGLRMWCGGQALQQPDCHGQGDKECSLTVLLRQGQDCEAEQNGQHRQFPYAELQHARQDRYGELHVPVFFE